MELAEIFGQRKQNLEQENFQMSIFLLLPLLKRYLFAAVNDAQLVFSKVLFESTECILEIVFQIKRVQ